MRSALTSLIVAAGLATAAQAQAPAAAPEMPATTPAAPAPAATAPVDAAAPAAAPAAVDPAAAPATPAEPAPTLPTTGDGAVVISLLEKICVPAVHGQGYGVTAKAAGFKLNKREGTWSMPLGGDKAYTVTLLPQGANTNVCQVEIHYAIGQDAPMVTALNVWAFLHQPQLILGANYVNVDPDGVKRVRKSWESLTATNSVAVNFSTMRKPDDTPLNPRFDSAMLFYQERTF